MVKFVVGVNQPYFERYGNDLGKNQFSGSELWHWPHTDPITFDFTKPETNPTPPLLTTEPWRIEQFFQAVQGVDIVRIWLFEKLEGIGFDANNRIVGMDADLVNNLVAILDAADSHGIKIYMCLLNSWIVKNEPPSGLPPARLSHYDTYNATVRNIMKEIVDDPFDFVNNVLDPLVASIANHPAVYAVDIMNEPEGMITDTPVVSHNSMRNFVSQCCNKIQPQLKASVGTNEFATAKNFSDLPIDFCDFHSYKKIPALGQYRPNDFSGKSCIVGECGYPVSSTNAAERSSKEVQTAKDYVDEVLARGYSGCLVWHKDFISDSNKSAILEWLKQFSTDDNQVVPPSSPSFFAAFIAWLAALLHR
jgi:hypothetical protein